MPLHIMSEAERCYQCKKPKCQEGCPVHTPIPEIIKLFREHNLMKAGEILFRNNPLSVICSEVCNHAKQCAGNCIRGKKDSPVHFSSIENYISEMYLD
ncbi:MAG: NAD(P)-dependent oxidoreductase, partial [Synergistaceae bacterium]|nr:NAD(P)-dependent oxidoreductase [Synergistaceae bacterium]